MQRFLSSTLTTLNHVYTFQFCVCVFKTIISGCTATLQPCDVSWNKPFKDRFRDLYDDWLVSGVVELTNAGNRKPPPKPLILRWIKEAWSQVSEEVVRKSFKKTGQYPTYIYSTSHLWSTNTCTCSVQHIAYRNPVF